MVIKAPTDINERPLSWIPIVRDPNGPRLALSNDCRSLSGRLFSSWNQIHLSCPMHLPMTNIKEDLDPVDRIETIALSRRP